MPTTRTHNEATSQQVVLASSQKGWGGGEVYLSTLAKELRARGTTVEFVVRANSVLEQHATDAKYPFHAVQGRGRNPLEIYRLRRWLRSRRPLTLHCNDSHALLTGGLAAYRLGSVRVVAMRHTMFPVRSPFKYLRLADQVVCVSHAVADLCQARGIPANRLRVIHAGVDTPKTDQNQAQHLRQQYLPSDEHQLIVAVGNLLPCKGHLTLITAAAHLKSMGVLAKTIIAGEGNERQALEEKIASLGLINEVELLGFREDANALLAAADVVTHPAFNEGLCLTVAAAMMLKRPIVATAVGGLEDVLGIDRRMNTSGPYASTFEPGDAKQLANKLREAVSSPPQQQSLVEAHAFAVDRFTTIPMADATLKLYRDLWQSRAA